MRLIAISYLILSDISLSDCILSYPIIPYPILYYLDLILFYRILSYPILYYLILYVIILAYHILCYLVISYIIVYHMLFHLILSYLTLYYLISAFPSSPYLGIFATTGNTRISYHRCKGNTPDDHAPSARYSHCRIGSAVSATPNLIVCIAVRLRNSYVPVNSMCTRAHLRIRARAQARSEQVVCLGGAWGNGNQGEDAEDGTG